MTKLKFKNVPVSVKVIYIFFFVLFTFFSILYIYPLIWALLNSFKSMKEYATNSLTLPEIWRWGHYLDVFTEFQAVPLPVCHLQDRTVCCKSRIPRSLLLCS